MAWKTEPSAIRDRPCVFLSHKSEDKWACRKLATYFADLQIDYYLDELDLDLQAAAAENNAEQVTNSIQKRNCEQYTYVGRSVNKYFKIPMNTFEIGYGHAVILDNSPDTDEAKDKKKLGVLTLKDYSEEPLMDYMHAAYIIRGSQTLNTYLGDISETKGPESLSLSIAFRNYFMAKKTIKDPLYEILDFSR